MRGLPKSAVVVAAHSDDPIIGMGGTISLLSSEGWKVEVVVACGDRAHGFEESIERLGGIPLLLDHTFASIDEDRLRGQLEDIFTSSNPDMVFTHWEREILVDHEVVSKITYHLARKREREIFMFEIPASSVNFSFNVAVDISDHYEKKREAINLLKGSFKPEVFENEILPSVVHAPAFRGIQVGCKYSEVFHYLGSRKPLSPMRHTLGFFPFFLREQEV